ncbi:MAG: septation ring formation regulator EzrA [Bacilli bacterium]
MDNLLIVLIFVSIITIIFIVVILNVMQNYKQKKIKKMIEDLEIKKNQIDGTPVAPYIEKVEGLLKNEKIEIMYNSWQERIENIKNTQIPKITDMLLEADYSLSQMDYKATIYKIAKLEIELYRVKANFEYLLKEIALITDSEERNRGLITKLKGKYRDLLNKFQEAKGSFGQLEEIVFSHIENIPKKFEAFEIAMEKKLYEQVSIIVKDIDDSLKHLVIVLEELPAIILLYNDILPKRIEEVCNTYQQMKQEGYPLDYLNVEYNIEEAKKKMTDVITRSGQLNLEDCIFELKVLLEYFDNLFDDFEKEKNDRNCYEDINNAFKIKYTKTFNLVADIFSQMGQVKNIYNLSKNDITLLNIIKNELDDLNKDYQLLQEYMNKQTFAYSKLTSEIENLVATLNNIEIKLDETIDSIGSLRDDEVRARQQLEEIKLILKDSKNKIKDYNLPIIPKYYYVEVREAQAAIKEIIKELEKKPITISVLNTRVDTARDLVLKLFTKTKEMMKTAMFAEMAIVYGNRYRSNFEDLNKFLTYAEGLFYKGEYKKSLEITINYLNKVEPGIYEKLLNLCDN